MKRRYLTFLWVLSLLMSLLPSAYAQVNGDDALVLVGLAYDKTALDGVNLQNDVGSGFRFGYLDENRAFWQVGYTTETALSVVKTQNVWYGIDPKYSDKLKCYSDQIVSDVAVGCWHVQLPLEIEPAAFEEAQAQAQALGGFPAWINGAWQVRLGAYTSQEEAQAMADTVGGTVAGTSAYGVSVVKTGTSTVLFQFDGGENVSLTVKPGLDDSVKTVTHFRGARYYGMFQFRRIKGGGLTVINALDLDDYTNCVISQEMSPSWPLEALKAQAVCARTYWEYHKNKHRSSGFDLCPSTHCQAYPGMSTHTERTTQAVQETAGLRIWYEGKPIDAVYFSSDGGATEDVRNVWGGSLAYLKGIEDPYEATVANKISKYNWTVTYTADELTDLLQSKGHAVGTTIVDFQITETTPMGNVKSIAFVGANGKSWPFTKESTRTFLGLRSQRYTVTKSGGEPDRTYYTDGGNTLSSLNGAYAIDGSGSVSKIEGEPYVITGAGIQRLSGASGGEIVFTINGSGWGHNVGMSQWGAYAMAQQGFSYDQILKFYYSGIEIY